MVNGGASQEVDPVQLLFLHCGNVLQEARFIQGSIPNVDDNPVEGILRQLHSVHKILEDLDDPWLTTEELKSLVALILDVAAPLQQWLDRPKEKHHPHSNPNEKGNGRPRYILDLDRAIELHDMELSWKQIADAMCIS